MEESIKQYYEHAQFSLNKEDRAVIENIIDGYRELEEENKNLKTKYDKYGRVLFTQEAIAEKYIPKSKIKEKIEELQLSLSDDCFNIIFNFSKGSKIKVLQELMEDK